MPPMWTLGNRSRRAAIQPTTPPAPGPAAATGIADPAALRRYVTRSAAICVIGLLCNQVSRQLAIALLARRLPNPATYGALSILLQLITLMALGLGLGINNALVYDIATGRSHAARSFAAARASIIILAALPVGLCLAAAPLVGALYHQPQLAGALRLACLLLFAQGALNAAGAVQSGLRRFSVQTALMVGATTLAAIGWLAAVPLVRHGASLGWIPLAGGCGVALVAGVGLWLGARALPGPAGPPASWLRELPRMLRYGWPLWAGNLLKAFQQSYLVLVAGAAGVTAAGDMANDVALIGWPFLVTWAFRMVTVPIIAAGRPEERATRATLCFRLNHLALFPLVALLCFWPHQLVTLVYGARYASAAPLLPLLALGVYGSSIGRLGTDVLAGSNQTRASLPIMIISSVPLLLGAPFALTHGARWLGALYCGGWLASGGYAYLTLRRLDVGVGFRHGFVEPLLPTLCALPCALAATHWHSVPLAAAAGVILLGVTALVFRSDGWGRGPAPARLHLPWGSAA